MTGTAVVSHVANLPAALPDFLQSAEIAQHVEKFNAAAMGGIKSGGFPRLSLSGSKFFILDSSAEVPRQLITVMDPSGSVAVPAMVLSVIIVGANPGISKVYYEGAYVPGEDREPDCSSDDGIRPDPHLSTPQHSACATCPQNAWGSRTTPQGKESKACSDSKRLVLIPEGDLNYKAMALSITPAMLKDWGAYVRMLSNKKVPVHAVVTRLTFDPNVDFPKLNFAFGRFLSKPEFDRVLQRMESDEVKNIEKPVRTPAAPALSAPTAAALPVIQAPAAPAQPEPPQAPPTPTATFGGASAAPVTAPVQPTITAPSPEVAPAPPPVVDPLAGLPPETIAAINAVGGIQTATGAIIFNAARASVAPATQAANNVVSMESGKRPRGRPAKTQPAAPADPAPAQAATFPTQSPTAAPVTTAPVAGTPPANPVAASPTPAEPTPTTGFATSPAAVVVPPGNSGLAGGLDQMLADIMGGNK